MSDSPPLRHLDVSPIAAVAGTVFLVAVVASTVLGAGVPAEAAAAVVAAGLAAGVAVLARRRR
ncbi:hypothetical protein [Halosimplex halophilum]|uniref:hypothetical protein n=1 Tax=Halosimplex halophilum TaxID=2559572 RepID=UPI00107F5CFD|nr:hypothetical protein [Halosimplex halophilum]